MVRIGKEKSTLPWGSVWTYSCLKFWLFEEGTKILSTVLCLRVRDSKLRYVRSPTAWFSATGGCFTHYLWQHLTLESDNHQTYTCVQRKVATSRLYILYRIQKSRETINLKEEIPLHQRAFHMTRIASLIKRKYYIFSKPLQLNFKIGNVYL
jgi:hypothetical protein